METKIKNYININEILSRLLRNPMFKDVTKEQVIQYVIDFVTIAGEGFPMEEREDILEVRKFRAVLPCDIIKIQAIQDLKSHLNMRAMTDDFLPQNHKHGCHTHHYPDNKTFRVQGRTIWCSFECGKIKVSYRTFKVDEDGFPLILEDSMFLTALEWYCKVQIHTILFENGQINQNVLNHTEQQYAWAIGRWTSHLRQPDMAQMESIKNMQTTLIQNMNGFRDNWRSVGDPELLINH